MASVGLMPDPNVNNEPIEGGTPIVDRLINGEITLEEFVGMIPKKESEVMPLG